MNRLVTILIIVLLANVGSALAVVYARHDSRALAVRLGDLEKSRDEAMKEWSRLQLEQSYLADAGNVEAKARRELGMIDPEDPQILVIRQ
ncbi:cell division protein FtsL [Marinihelvus fidelis]|uniref:Cell division protein FtsL n=1 Tax=Marinihelvus fidelis TaxID=2613842 RepID=A0A5N0T3S7_9GAMM|nr:cell division protein FtsL [Marinihelvus fidelis]KAA9129720.1 cell division protein FtsL [Marinihelvus fidelis]